MPVVPVPTTLVTPAPPIIGVPFTLVTAYTTPRSVIGYPPSLITLAPSVALVAVMLALVGPVMVSAMTRVIVTLYVLVDVFCAVTTVAMGFVPVLRLIGPLAVPDVTLT